MHFLIRVPSVLQTLKLFAAWHKFAVAINNGLRGTFRLPDPRHRCSSAADYRPAVFVFFVSFVVSSLGSGYAGLCFICG
jgi:hypothetical protein